MGTMPRTLGQGLTAGAIGDPQHNNIRQDTVLVIQYL
jgi:hypothetical protein